MNIKWLPLKVKQIILGFIGHVAHLTVLEGYYDLSLKPHSRVSFMATRASVLKDMQCLKVIFINLLRFPKFAYDRGLVTAAWWPVVLVRQER